MRRIAAFTTAFACVAGFQAPALADVTANAMATPENQPLLGALIPKLEDNPTNRTWTRLVGAEALITGKTKFEADINPQVLPLFGIGSPFMVAGVGRSALVGSIEGRIVTGNAAFGNWTYLARDNQSGLMGYLGRIGFTRNFSPFEGVRIEPGLGLGYLGIGADDGRGNISTLTAWNGVAATMNVIGRPGGDWPLRYNVNANYTHMILTGGNLFTEVGVDYLPSTKLFGSDVSLGLGVQAFLMGQFAGNWSPAIRVGFGL